MPKTQPPPDLTKFYRDTLEELQRILADESNGVVNRITGALLKVEDALRVLRGEA